jgi:predicted transcriptional regulator
MTPEEVAERYQERGGFRLIDYREVALPTYSVSTRILTLARKRVPVIEEFILRGMAAGLNTADAIAGFLGLDQRVVNAALATLTAADDAALTASDTSRRHVWRLTPKGQKTLEQLESVVPEQRVVPIPFDGILRTVRDFSAVPTYAPREVRELGLLQIPPTQARKPQLADLTADAVEALLKKLSGDTEASREVLAVQEILRSDRRFIPAIALLYESDTGGEFQLGFAIDGVISPEHEAAFARAGGLARLKIYEQIAGSRRERPEELAQAVATVQPTPDDRRTRREVAERKGEIRTLREQLRVTESGEKVDLLESRIAELEALLSVSEAQRKVATTRFLYCFDHPPLLRDALTNAASRVLIISPWIMNSVVDSEFRALAEALLQRNVDLYIGWGFGDDSKSSPAAIRFFDDLSRRYRNFHWKHLGNTHAKVLLMDDAFVVLTSFNWLSFRGDADRTFRDEQGVVVSDPERVNDKFRELEPRFTG